MKTKQALKFKRGIVMNLVDKELPEYQLELIHKLVDSGERFIINTNLSNKVIDLLGAAYRDARLNTGGPLHLERSRYENGATVTRYNEVYGEYIRAAETLADGIDSPILINIKLDPDIAKELSSKNDKPFIISGCHVMEASLNLDLRPQKNELWIDDLTVQPHPKNERCVNPNIEPFKNEYNVKKPGDAIVPAVTLKQLQDKAIKYDALMKDYKALQAKGDAGRLSDLTNAISGIKWNCKNALEHDVVIGEALAEEIMRILKDNGVDDIEAVKPWDDPGDWDRGHDQ